MYNLKIRRTKELNTLLKFAEPEWNIKIETIINNGLG
jgi:hypothetical protein